MFFDFGRGCSLLMVVLAVLIVVGCGGGPAEHQVTGTVTFDGQPMEEGEIVFFPANMEGTPQASPIIDGKFECRVTEGQKRVEITATRESAKPAPDGLPDYVSYVPAAYNSESTLTAEVKPEGDNTFTFPLQSQGPGR